MGICSLNYQRAIFLDRDGVLNALVEHNGELCPPASLRELQILPGTKDALLKLRGMGFALIVVTNQPGVARGTLKKSTVEAIHRELLETLPIQGIYACYHDDADKCHCRKPKPGLLLDAARECQISLMDSYMVGDRWRDVEAGQGAGCRTVWVDLGEEKRPSPPPDITVHSLPEAVFCVSQEWKEWLR